jgi:nucleotide-binding universal stress UspA family protein
MMKASTSGASVQMETAMAIKNILVLLSGKNDVAGPYALSLAQLFDAHIAAAAPVPQPLPDAAFVALPYAVVEASHRDARAVATQRLEEFRTAVERAGAAASFELIDNTGEPFFDTIARTARHYDFTIVGQPSPDEPAHTLVEDAATNSGRPVLVVPHIHKKPAAFDTIVVAWDESQPATRAVNEAIPLLLQAKTVQVVTVTKPHLGHQRDGDFDIMRHLARHGVFAEFKDMPSSIDVGNTLLSHTFDLQADLLVMGMYGHSPTRERLFGGVTRTILKAMTLPVFMARAR